VNDFRQSLLPACARLIIPVQYLISIYLLLRGHNLPGGGFIGGLVLASALVLRAMVDPARAPKIDLVVLSGIGLLVAAFSAMMPWLVGGTFFAGLWGGEIWLPMLGKIKFGTPLLFDIGVFMVVTGVAAKLLLVMMVHPDKSED